MREQAIITDVGPRDGLQNQSQILTIAQRAELVRALATTGIGHVEIGSFVSPKAVPAMAGTDALTADLGHELPARLIALIPNLKGYELAKAAGIKAVTMVVYASEGMAQKNVRMSRQQADDAASSILAKANEDGIDVITTIAVGFECPFDGASDPGIVREQTARYLEQGADSVVVADTIGAANPAQVSELSKSLVAAHGHERLGMHFHDTRSMGLANVYAAAEAGIRRFDASISGLGGCPFAPGASGNVATEEVVFLLDQLGFDTGVNMQALLEASALTETLIGKPSNAKSRNWLRKRYLSS